MEKYCNPLVAEGETIHCTTFVIPQAASGINKIGQHSSLLQVDVEICIPQYVLLIPCK